MGLPYKTNVKNAITDAHIPQSWEIALNTMRYKRSETVSRSGDFQNRQSFVKVEEKITCKRANMYIKVKYKKKAIQ